MSGSVPGQDRHSPPVAAPAARGRHPAVADAVARRAACVAALVVGNAREAALSAVDVGGGACRGAAGATAAGEAGEARSVAAGVGARPRVARSAGPVVQGLVEEPGVMSARDAILGRVRAALAGDPDVGPPPSYELWPQGTWPPPDDLFARFVEE